MSKILKTKTNRKTKCRICSEIMEPGTTLFKLSQVHVSPKTVDLFFHTCCLKDAIAIAEDEYCHREFNAK